MFGEVAQQMVIVTLAFVVNPLAQGLWLRVKGYKRLVVSLLFGFMAGFVFLFFCESYLLCTGVLSIDDLIPYAILNLLIYVGVSYVYFHYINIGEASVRIRVLSELTKSLNGLPRDIIQETYSAKTILQFRILRLTETGEISLSNGRYFHRKSKILWVARVFVFLKRCILGRHWNDPITSFNK